jgi:hypothetical protein
MLLQL